jgi:hypothetical protein
MITITREKLLATASPEIDFVHIEPAYGPFDGGGWYIHFHRHGNQVGNKWFKGLCYLEDFKEGAPWPLKWFKECNELPRRWKAMYEPLENWIRELGLKDDYIYAAMEFFGVSVFCPEIGLSDPHRAEKRPEFALKFLKERLLKHDHASYVSTYQGEGGASLQLRCSDCNQCKGPELYKGEDGVYRCYKCSREPKGQTTIGGITFYHDTEPWRQITEINSLGCSKEIIGYAGDTCVSCRKIEASVIAEPECHCNVNLGHDPDCAWKKWFKKHGS